MHKKDFEVLDLYFLFGTTEDKIFYSNLMKPKFKGYPTDKYNTFPL